MFDNRILYLLSNVKGAVILFAAFATAARFRDNFIGSGSGVVTLPE
jgi:hypothetical protein